MKSRILTLFLLLMASFSSVAEITNIELTQNEFSLIAGETAQIRMKVTANGEYRMSYNSYDKSIAQVSDDGTITAVGEGSTTIFIMGDWDNAGEPYMTSVTVNVTMPDGMFYVDNFKCKFTDDTRSAISILGEVVHYTQVSWTLNIPATLKPVFMDADIPVTHIADGAFGGCDNLKEVKLYSDALKNVSIQDAFGLETFQNATLTVPQGTLSVFAKETGWNKFHCIAESDALFTVDGLLCRLDDRKFKDGQVIIDGALFPDETGETLIIPGSLTYKGEIHPIRHIWNDAFAGNERIKRIVIQPGEEYIYLGNRCFGNVPFTSFELDRNFTWQRGQESQSPFKYEGDAPLAALILGDNMTEVGNNGFTYAGSRFDKVQMSDNITSIGYDAFGNFTNITELKLPSRLEEIGKMAFRKCSRLKSLIIPASVKSIGEYAFSSCIALETLEF